jgi:hypothetical protein
MVSFALGNSGKYYNKEWHIKREKALRETWNIDEWGDIDITKYDLDELDFSRKDNPRSYTNNHPIVDDEIDLTGFDIRDLPTHD